MHHDILTRDTDVSVTHQTDPIADCCSSLASSFLFFSKSHHLVHSHIISLRPPILEVQQNDTVRIHVTNQLGAGTTTSVHHHGLFFRKEDLSSVGYYDGAPGITQCGIPNNMTLTYEVPVWQETGTYWWHSHNVSLARDLGIRCISIPD